jgi:hypothetical protein
MLLELFHILIGTAILAVFFVVPGALITLGIQYLRRRRRQNH